MSIDLRQKFKPLMAMLSGVLFYPQYKFVAKNFWIWSLIFDLTSLMLTCTCISGFLSCLKRAKRAVMKKVIILLIFLCSTFLAQIKLENTNVADLPKSGENYLPISFSNEWQMFHRYDNTWYSSTEYWLNTIRITDHMQENNLDYYKFSKWENTWIRYDLDSNRIYWKDSDGDKLYVDFNWEDGYHAFYPIDFWTDKVMLIETDSIIVNGEIKYLKKLSYDRWVFEQIEEYYLEDFGFYYMDYYNWEMGSFGYEETCASSKIIDQDSTYKYYDAGYEPEITWNGNSFNFILDTLYISTEIDHFFSRASYMHIYDTVQTLNYLEDVKLSYYYDYGNYNSDTTDVQLIPDDYLKYFSCVIQVCEEELLSGEIKLMARIYAKDKSLRPHEVYYPDDGYVELPYSSIIKRKFNDYATESPPIKLSNYPNPFNPETVITFELPEDEMIDMLLFNSIGEKIATLASGLQKAGRHTLRIDAAKLSLTSGVYICVLRSNKKSISTKLLLLK